VRSYQNSLMVCWFGYILSKYGAPPQSISWKNFQVPVTPILHMCTKKIDKWTVKLLKMLRPFIADKTITQRVRIALEYYNQGQYIRRKERKLPRKLPRKLSRKRKREEDQLFLDIQTEDRDRDFTLDREQLDIDAFEKEFEKRKRIKLLGSVIELSSLSSSEVVVIPLTTSKTQPNMEVETDTSNTTNSQYSESSKFSSLGWEVNTVESTGLGLLHGQIPNLDLPIELDDLYLENKISKTPRNTKMDTLLELSEEEEHKQDVQMKQQNTQNQIDGEEDEKDENLGRMDLKNQLQQQIMLLFQY